MSLQRALWSGCVLLAALALLLGNSAAAQEKGPPAKALEPAWSLEGPWTGVVGDDSKGAIYAIGHDAGKCVELDAAGKSQRTIKLPESSGSIVRLATLGSDRTKTLLTFSVWVKDLRAYDLDGKHLWTYPQNTGIDDVWAGDLNGAGSDEVIVGYNGNAGLHVLDGKAQVLWKSTGIGNVWHVCAGDVLGDGKSRVVTTSAVGKAHVFDADGKKSKDLDAGCYATMVRIAKPSGREKAATILVAGSALADKKVIVLTALSGDGNKRWSLELLADSPAHVNSAYVAPGKPWIAMGLQGGSVHVVDIDKGQVLASVKDQGMVPEVGWVKGKEAGRPLLLVATGTQLNAYHVPDSK